MRGGDAAHLGVPRKKQEPGEGAALRRSGRHCPVCLAMLPRIAGGGTARRCAQCGAAPSEGRRCGSCGREALWEGPAEAGCVACGLHGSKVAVIAGHRWLAEDGE